MNLGETIYNLRKEKKLSQGDLAEQLSVSRQSVSKWENNSAVPDLDKLVKLSTIFGVSLDELVKGEMPAGEADNGGQAAEAEHTDTAKSIITKRFIYCGDGAYGRRSDSRNNVYVSARKHNGTHIFPAFYYMRGRVHYI